MKPIPTINVNLMKCHHSKGMANDPVHKHACMEQPLPIPCPIPPSVTFTVRLGECLCHGVRVEPNPTQYHHGGCKGAPIRVSCSISGDGTWAGSEVSDAWPDARPAPVDGKDYPRLIDACRARWALVKALVCNVPTSSVWHHHDAWQRLVSQRDAVFAALANMVRHEVGHAVAMGSAIAAIGDRQMFGAMPASEAVIARYVARLIEQVGVIDGGQ